jgi:hypothetical protein
MDGEDLDLQDVIVRVAPARTANLDVQSGTDPLRSYDVLIYALRSDLGLKPPSEPQPGYSPTLGRWPLAGVEQVQVSWNRYQEYLADFIEGEKLPSTMRSKLIRTMSDGLRRLFTLSGTDDAPIRVWWSNATPELEDLPWELVALSERGQNPAGFSFVRGQPIAPLPLVPMPGDSPLRVALIFPDSLTSPSLLAAVQGPRHGLLAQKVPGPLRNALRQAAHEGYEVIHLVADGAISLAYEGLIAPIESSTATQPLSGSELSDLLRGSRVGLLILTPPQEISSPQAFIVAGHKVPAVYRAFAYLGASQFPIPTTVTPLGPLDEQCTRSFWGGFYDRLADTMNVEKAVASGKMSALSAAVGLYLRHRHGQVFRRLEPGSAAPELEPMRAFEQLQFTSDILRQVRQMRTTGKGLDVGLESIIGELERGQESVKNNLKPWLK